MPQARRPRPLGELDRKELLDEIGRRDADIEFLREELRAARESSVAASERAMAAERRAQSADARVDELQRIVQALKADLYNLDLVNNDLALRIDELITETFIGMIIPPSILRPH